MADVSAVAGGPTPRKRGGAAALPALDPLMTKLHALIERAYHLPSPLARGNSWEAFFEERDELVHELEAVAHDLAARERERQDHLRKLCRTVVDVAGVLGGLR